MGLREYKRKRHFDRTPEPEGKTAAAGGRSYVIQKHAATHLHYDFRLELEGALKSWAVPKGPSLDPHVKRLAMQVEDHPVDYGSFEGIIPKGEYGGGTVMLWDRGTWEPRGNAHDDYRAGRLKFTLHGEKLRGNWMLVRTARKDQKDQRHWLLFKERDAEAKTDDGSGVTERLARSVATGRSLEEIAAAQDRVWNSKPRAKSRRQYVVPATNGKATKPAAKTSTRQRLAALAAAVKEYDATSQQYRGVRLTSPEKVLYPEQGITKIELAHYYSRVADWILPHIKDRPLVLVRCPEGREKECFYQKHPGVGTPTNLRQVSIREKRKTEPYVIVDDVDGLISLVQIGTLEIHAWGSRADKLDFPDRLIFDLDPGPEVLWSHVVSSARQVREFLQEIGLESFVKTTGGKGLHLMVPIDRRHDWDQAKAFCKRVAELIVSADPGRYTANMAKAARTGKIYIDYLRNDRGATAIIPYSTRARYGATVAMPLTWRELTPRLQPDQFTVESAPGRLARRKQDPWAGFDDVRQTLSKPLSVLNNL